MQNSRLLFQKGDITAIILVAVLAALVFLCFVPKQSAAPAYVEIYQNGKLVHTLSLSEPQDFVVTAKYSNTVTIRDGKVAVTQSNCPGGDCVSCGWTNSSARSIACLPNGLEIRVVSESADVDFVVG